MYEEAPYLLWLSYGLTIGAVSWRVARIWVECITAMIDKEPGNP